ncbi:hypothetical protein CCAX7_25870 [Capsulimonas corticalis]|uniref:Uncharacterized protein n=2 Tax=Capsulimonas corticalis TaxID=2219043 RepID=A0A402CVV0_9BACT|nr:hypothetical protein CCAX7_25870 [Capsulimonas corticalis]
MHEWGADFPSYDPKGDEDARPFLWVANTGGGWYQAVGAVNFRKRNWSHVSPWGLEWIWLHPFARGRGYLKAAWPYFEQEFGDFIPEPPYSPAMRHFLLKNWRGELGDMFRKNNGVEERASKL